MTPREILGSFCQPVTALGSVLEGPWREGTHAYATNRCWMVRMPAAGMGSLMSRTLDHPQNAAAIFETAPRTGFAPMAPLPAANPCPMCWGTLVVQTHACRPCAGTGRFKHYGLEYRCAYCEGSGRTWRGGAPCPPEPEQPCTTCSGTGFDLANHQRTQLGKQGFQLGYLHAIAKLPGVTFAAGQGSGVGAFRFDGDGEGVLMPCPPPRSVAGF